MFLGGRLLPSAPVPRVGGAAAAPPSRGGAPKSSPLDSPSLLSDISVMTEITDSKDLPAAIERFVLHWGDMGSHWGVNRSVSQIHALLYLTDTPQTAEDIAETLGMARSNVSNSLKELLSWNLIRRVPVKGDRRDHFVAETDLWDMFLRIAAGRKEREIDPAIAALRACAVEAEADKDLAPVAAARLNDMLTFVTMMERWYAQMLTVPKSELATLIRLGTRILALRPPGKRK
jgi:DNA-binding transcriptional regulator GbsR (MarR family)